VLAAFQKEKTAHVGMGNQILPEPLSKRELQVLQLLAHGSSNLEIAQKLVITVDTVKRHVSHIFSKFGVQNRLQAVNLARDLDIVSK
jgi:LuxR family maltose regulon positive regulatory protein